MPYTTREISFWTTLLRKEISVSYPNSTPFEVYVFGSALREAQPADLDIVIVYDSITLSRNQLAKECSRFATWLLNLTSLPVDLCRLTYEEAASSRFLLMEGAVRVYPSAQ